MKTTPFRELRARKSTPAELKKVDAWVRREALAMTLRELRAEAGLSQASLAEAAEIAQTEISKIERRDDHLLSTLRRYVEGLGGELEVVAVLGNKRISLHGV
jgi:DNA-binding XRE family transcriptional regulator